jgi:hypothetical protein
LERDHQLDEAPAFADLADFAPDWGLSEGS